MKRHVAAGMAFALLCGCSAPSATGSDQAKPVAALERKKAAFGKTADEVAASERQKALAGLGDRWVVAAVTSENSSPGGDQVNRIYRGQRLTIYEEQSGWVRTTADGYTPRWSRTRDLSTTEPPPAPEYAGPAQFRDPRIEIDAIPNPGENDLTKADVDILWKGAKLVLDSQDCGQVTMADKSVSKKNTYYVTCSSGGAHNIFFTKAEVLAAK